MEERRDTTTGGGMREIFVVTEEFYIFTAVVVIGSYPLDKMTELNIHIVPMSISWFYHCTIWFHKTQPPGKTE